MKKNNKRAAVFSMILIFAIACPCSIIRTDSGFALVKNILIAQDSSESDDKVDKKDESADDKSGEVPAKDKSSDSDKKDIPKLYDYSKQNVEETSTGWLYFKFFLMIGLLLAGFYFFFRFVTKKAGIANVGADAVNVLTAVPLGPNKYIQIVEIAGQIFVLGITDSNISMITEITDKDNKDRIKLLSSKSTPIKNANFQKYFNDSIGFITSLITKKPDTQARPQKDDQQSGFRTDEDTRRRNSRDNEYLDEYIDNDKMEYLKRQKDRLKKLNGFNDED